MTMYELFILGELLDHPLHGYLLRDIVNLAIGPIRKMSWGGLYPLMRRLEEDGLIEQLEEKGGSKARPRKIYKITAKGKAHFFDLMLKPEEYTLDYPDIFNIKLLNFDHLSKEQQLSILQHYRGFVQFLLGHFQANERYVTEHHHIPDSERPYVLQVIAHRSHLASADLAWIEAEIARLS